MKKTLDYSGHRNLTMDFAKGIAMIMIILVHSRQWVWGLSAKFDLLKFGQMGCQIFFLVSGFLCCESWERIVLEKKEAPQKKLSWKHLKKFYLKKYISIAPGYYLMMSVCWMLNKIMLLFANDSLGFATNDNGIAILRNVLMVHGLTAFGNNDVVAGGWYIGTLILMILLFPFLFEVLYNFKAHINGVVLGIVSISCIIIWNLYYSLDISVLGNNSFWYFNILTQIPCFVFGCLLYFNRNMRSGFSMFLVGGICIVLSTILFFSGKNVFLFIPLIFAWGVYLVLRPILYKSEKRNYWESRDKIIDIVGTTVGAFGRNSFYLYLAHPFFVWLMVRELQEWLKAIKCTVSPNILYICLLPFVFCFSYLLAVGIKHICYPIQRVLKRVLIE